MPKEKQVYLNADVEILDFNCKDIVTTSGGSNWLNPGGNVDSEGWTQAQCANMIRCVIKHMRIFPAKGSIEDKSLHTKPF